MHLPSGELDRLTVVLVATRNPLNLGAAARAMSNFGVGALRVVHPFEASFREARSAVGAEQLLARAQECASVAEAVADCTLVVGSTAGHDRTLQHSLKPLEKAAPLIRRKLARGRVALLFGSEKRGLSNDDLSHCHWLLRIPTREAHPSMNLGQAVAVCLYELVRQPKAAERVSKAESASAGDLERLGEFLCEGLRLSGYTRPGSTKSLELEVRRMLRRLQIGDADAKTWLGMLRQVLWKLHAGGKKSG